MLQRAALGFLLLFPLGGQNNSRPSFAEPAISPDRSEIAFVSGGDIWTVPANGGEARLLVSHPALEVRPVYSPDGKRLAFTSARTGNGDVYLLDFTSGAVRRLTFHEASERVDGWSRDGKYVYFSSSAADVAGMNDVFRVPAEGGTPMLVSDDRYASEYFSAESPAGDGLAITAKGLVSAQWWRNGHSHIDESEIFVRREGEPAKYEAVSGGGSKNAWPMWSGDGKRLLFMSDRSGSENIWEKPVAGGQARQVTTFKQGRVLWPSISYDGKTVVFERDFEIWRMETASGKAAPVAITLRGAPAAPAVTRLSMTSGFRDLALSADGKKVAFTAHGEVFSAAAKEGGMATRLTNTTGAEGSPAWAPDSRRVAYTSDRDGVQRIFLYDFTTNKESQVTKAAGPDSAPFWSPDGKSIAFLRGGSKVVVHEVASGKETELATGHFGLPPLEPARPLVWSPDSKYIAYTVPGPRQFRNVAIVAVSGGAPIHASFLPNMFSNSVSWSPDGKYILFDTGQRTEQGRIARIDLIPRTPRFREDQFRELFREDPVKPQQPAPGQPPAAATPAGAPQPQVTTATDDKSVKVVAEGIRHRSALMPVGVDVGWHAISPDGKSLLMIASAAGQQNLWLYSLDELAREPAIAKQLTSTPGSKRDPWFSPDNKEVYFLEQGRVQVVNVETRQVRPIAITAEMDVDFAREKHEVFKQAWTYLNDHFYDEKFHGIDWTAQRSRLAPYVEGARTPDELYRVLSLMIGELNASHLGISAGSSGTPARSGNLGLRFDRREYEASGKLRVTEVILQSPAAVAGVKPGEYLEAVDGAAITARTNLQEILEHQAGKRVVLTIASGSDKREAPVSPVSGVQEKALLYRHWVDSRREYVSKASGGRLGYVHMPDMSSNSLDQLYLDLDTENHSREGVVVDIRNNNGGFVNVYALDVLSRRGFLNMTVRGAPTVPARSALGQRALEKPTILVVNQHSLSDAEDFTEGYRSMKIGKVVGEPTAGWIIYTSGAELIDGSFLRLPRTRITDNAGVNMERNPRPVDIPTPRPFGESAAGKDSQLDAAVRELLKQIDAEKRARPTT